MKASYKYLSDDMEISADKIAELRAKNLEMIQVVILRIANYSATLKNYCITLVTAACGFSITLKIPAVALLALLPIVLFGLLDAQYLRIERRFRALFEKTRQEDWGTLPTFEITIVAVPTTSYIAVLRTWSITSFYAPLGIGIIGAVLIARHLHGQLL